MRVKTVTSLVAMLVIPLCVSNAFAEQIMNKVNLNKVTLFFNGAELNGSSQVAVPKGESEIILTQLANNINVNSINVGIGDKAMILSTTLVSDYLIKKDPSPELKILQDELNQLNKQQQNLEVKLEVVSEEIALLKNNRINSINQAKQSLNEASLTIDFIKSHLTNALTEQDTLEQQLDSVVKKIVKQQDQIALISGDNNPLVSVIKVKIYSPTQQILPLTVSYLTPDAGWMPIYDVRVKDINSPLQLTYKAKVYQRSGLAWDNVDFTLSTANPTESITPPQLQPWLINLNDNKSPYKSMRLSSKMVANADYNTNFVYEATKLSNNFNDYVMTTNNGLNEQFNITLPYTIMGYSDNNILTLKEQQIPVEYRYTATPKLNNNVFLQAQISDWDTLSLLPGNSTIFYAGNYVGEGYITTQGVEDKLNISLGIDKEILISRHIDTNERSKPSFFGNDVSQTFAYTIDVRNTKALPIDIAIYDQLPVIRDKVITLENAKYSGANYNKDSGLLTWQLYLKSKELKQLPFSFKLTYPKDQSNNIIGL